MLAWPALIARCGWSDGPVDAWFETRGDRYRDDYQRIGATPGMGLGAVQAAARQAEAVVRQNSRDCTNWTDRELGAIPARRDAYPEQPPIAGSVGPCSRIIDGIFVRGDHLPSASIEGAIFSGLPTADALLSWSAGERMASAAAQPESAAPSTSGPAKASPASTSGGDWLTTTQGSSSTCIGLL